MIMSESAVAPRLVAEIVMLLASSMDAPLPMKDWVVSELVAVTVASMTPATTPPAPPEMSASVSVADSAVIVMLPVVSTSPLTPAVVDAFEVAALWAPAPPATPPMATVSTKVLA